MNKREFFKMSLTGVGALALAGNASALEFYPTPSEKKWAVLFGTWCGSSRDAGVWISEGMDGIAQVFDVRENPDLSGYEHLVIGGSIRSGQVPPELQEYLRMHQAALKPRIRGLYAVCGNNMQPAGPEQIRTLIDRHLAVLCGVTDVPARVFLGRITYGLMDEASRQMIRGFGMPEYDNLKRSECLEFGKEIRNRTI